MSYYNIKNIKVKEKENKISADIADSCWTDYNNRPIYSHCDDLFANTIGADIYDKQAYLMYNIIVGNYHSTKYKNLVCTFDYLREFVDEFKEAIQDDRTDDFKFIYDKHRDSIESWLNEDCYIRNQSNGYYVVRINKKTISLNYKSYAKKFNSNYVKYMTALTRNGYEIEKI